MMMINCMFPFLLVFNFVTPVLTVDDLVVSPSSIELSLGESANITFGVSVHYDQDIILTFNKSFGVAHADSTILNGTTGFGFLTITGKELTSRSFVDIISCTFVDQNDTKCPFDLANTFTRVSVYKSQLIDWLVHIVGWLYFLAWSISFYPQIYLNFRRKSVIGLNFDFLLLNVVGFTAYSCYNIFIYFDSVVQEEYEAAHPRSPIPVLLNDVVFAVHATFACIVTIIQCFFYERANQRVSRAALFISIGLVSLGASMATLAATQIITILVFVNSLSYLKMTVTLLKYFPQAYFNIQRKSTVGWSIGNVLLDFTGGMLDILQMILQASNVNDWSAFYGNPVKFGLGLVSIIFDMVFIFQHYVLYKSGDVPHDDYAGIDNPQPHTPPPHYGSNEDDHTAIVEE